MGLLNQLLAVTSIALATCVRAGSGLPDDYRDAISRRIFTDFPKYTGASARFFTPKRVAVPATDGETERKREYCGVRVDWAAYGEDGIALTLKFIGTVYLFESGKLVGTADYWKSEWPDGKPQEEKPNKMLLPTTSSVTPPSGASAAPAPTMGVR